MRLGEISEVMNANPALGSLLQPGRSAEVIEEISPNDLMYRGIPDLYFVVGETAVSYIRMAMLITGRQHVASILDLPSGHGRVLRTLKATFPDASLTACDTDQDGIEFCSKVFGSTAVLSREQPEEVSIDGQFDLIWCGSLLTHLDRDRWSGFLRLFESLLSPHGILVFTTHGRFAAEKLRSGAMTFEVAEDEIAGLVSDYDSNGFGYRPYPHPTHIGISLSSPTWVCAELARHPGLHLLFYTETGFCRGWAGQDVVACERVPDERFAEVTQAPPPPGSTHRLT